MLHFLQFTGNPESESRLIFAGLNIVPEQGSAGSLENAHWKQIAVGSDDMLDYFASARRITRDDIRAYIDAYEEEETVLPDSIQEDIRAAFDLIDDDSSTVEERTDAEKKIDRLCAFIQARSAVTKQTQEKLRGVTTEEKEVPTGIEYVYKESSRVLGACIDGFGNASGKEKAIMLAGVVAAFLAIRNVVRGGESMMPQGAKLLKNIVGTGAGLGLAYIGLQSVNKAVEKSGGRPLFDHRYLGGRHNGWLPAMPIITETQESWDKKRYDAIVDMAEQDLERGPQEVLRKIFTSEDMPDEATALANGMTVEEYQRKRRGGVAGIMNIATLDAESFAELYESSRDLGSTPKNASGYPKRPFAADGLSEAERYQLLRKIGETIGMIDSASGDLLELPKNKADKKMLYLMLDI